MEQPVVSVILPPGGEASCLRRCLDSVRGQTLREIEILWVDGADDETAAVLGGYAAGDDRVRVQTRGGKPEWTAAGKYLLFLEPTAELSAQALERCVDRAERYDAQITAFDSIRVQEDGREERVRAVRTEYLPGGGDTKVFCWRDCPDRLFHAMDATSRNRLYRADFYRDLCALFDGTLEEDAIAVCAAASAERITYVTDPLARYRVPARDAGDAAADERLRAVRRSVEDTMARVRKLPQYPAVEKAAACCSVDRLCTAFREDAYGRFGGESREYYAFLHRCFNQPPFDSLTRQDCVTDRQFLLYRTIREVDWETFRRRSDEPVTVSMTSFPARIGGVAAVLETIFRQTRVPDRIMLWLAEEQFPQKEAELPAELLALAAEGKLSLRWCDDLKPHKKYFYALQEIQEGVVITVDDDLLYPPELIEDLCLSYVRWPEAVSAVRTHLMAIDETGTILPYRYWIMETDALLGEPCMQLLATNGAGALFPAGIFPAELFDKAAVLGTCPEADDLWVKAMEVVCDIPVVTAAPYRALAYLPGSQEVALYRRNIDQNGNDIQLADIIRWVDGKYGAGFFAARLTGSGKGRSQLGMQAFCEHVYRSTLRGKRWDRSLPGQLQRANAQRSELNARLQQTYAEKSELNARLQQTYGEKSELNAKLQQTYGEKSELNATLQRTYAEKSELNAKLQRTYAEKSERGVTIREQKQTISALEGELAAVKSSAAYRLGRLLTWLPRKLRALFRAA
mgnify:CR=1 FL=1